MYRKFSILAFLIISLLLVSCASSDEDETITFTAVIEEVTEYNSWLVTTSDDVGFDQAYVTFIEDAVLAFNPMPGQTVTITIEPEVRESYPVQVTGLEASLTEKEATIAPSKKITAAEAKAIMDSEESYILVDVRTKEEFESGHIEGALLLPVTEIETLAENQLPDLDQIILVYCRSGNRSASATEILVELGYTNIFDFGGIADWPYEIVK